MARQRLPLEIFSYLDYRSFLNDLVVIWRKNNKSWNYKAFSTSEGYAASNYLKMVIDGSRNLSDKSIASIIHHFSFNKQESEFFQALVKLNQAKKDEEREIYYEKICSMPAYRERAKGEKEIHQFYSSWINPTIREMVNLVNFIPDPTWIRSILRTKISIPKIEQSLKLLLKSGQLKEDNNGKLIQSTPVMSTGHSVQSLSVSNYHREMMNQAKIALEKVSESERNISSLTMPVSTTMYDKIVDEIYLFQEKIIDMVNSEESTDNVVQLNFQLFPLTDNNANRGSNE